MDFLEIKLHTKFFKMLIAVLINDSLSHTNIKISKKYFRLPLKLILRINSFILPGKFDLNVLMNQLVPSPHEHFTHFKIYGQTLFNFHNRTYENKGLRSTKSILSSILPKP